MVILQRTKYSIFANFIWTTILVTVFETFKISFCLPSFLHSILGSALSLLLVFRTNSSYDRFWEGRKLWGQVISSSRDIVRLMSLHIEREKYEKIAKLLISFAITLKQHLQGERENEELTPFLDTTELEFLQSRRNRPIYALRLLSEEINKGLASSFSSSNDVVLAIHEGHFQEHIHSLNSAATACERIVKQPIPLSYSRHTSRFVFLFLYSLPLALIPYLHW
jgi:putative membrane protein